MTDKVELTSDVNGFPGCCGIGVLCNFEIDSEGDYRYDKAQATPKEFEKWYKSDVRYARGEYRHLMVTLVSSYKGSKTEQIPGFIEWLEKEKGWEKSSVFVNPNHGNEVTVLQKTFPKLLRKSAYHRNYTNRWW